MQPWVHGKPYFEAILPHPEAYTYITFPPIPTLEAFLGWVESRVRKDPSLVMFAMIDKTKEVEREEDATAGIIGVEHRHGDRVGRVRLGVAEDDIRAALRDDEECYGLGLGG